MARFRQELDACHPFFRGQSGLSRKVMEMGDQPLHQELQARVFTKGVDGVNVLRDVICRKVLHRWDLVPNLIRIQHCESEAANQTK